MSDEARTGGNGTGVTGTGKTGELHVVLGASGGTGAALVKELAARGRRVRAVARHRADDLPHGVEALTADLSVPVQLARAVDGAAVVYHAAQPDYTRWVREFPALTRGIMEASAAAGARLVFADNLYMYAPADTPLREDSAIGSPAAKGRLRAAMAEELLSAHRDGRARVVIARSSDYYGPGGTGSFVGERFFGALSSGRKVQWMVDLDQSHTLSYLPDMAHAMAILGERPDGDGRVWHLPAAEPLTGRRAIELAARVAGVEPRPAVITPAQLRLVGLFSPFLRQMPELLYQWQRPFVSDASAFEAAFGPFAVTSHEEALRATIEWYRAREEGGRLAA